MNIPKRQESSGQECARGRSASHPGEIPAPGWRDILLRVKQEVQADNLTFVAAGVSFYLMFALVPGLASAISIYGFFADPVAIQNQFDSLRSVLPSQVHEIVTTEMRRLSADSGVAGFGAIAGLAIALWSGSRGMMSLIGAMNIVYEEKERRGFFKLHAVALGFTLGATVLALVAVTMIVAVPYVLKFVGLGAAAKVGLGVARWVLLVLMGLVGLSLLYRFAPCREKARWQWITWGAVVAVGIWIISSILFSVYVSNFSDYNKTYGALGAVLVLLMWLYISSFAILLGGELNSEMEHQTAEDTTTGPPVSMGERGAKMADTVGKIPA